MPEKKIKKRDERWTIADAHTPPMVDTRGFCHYHKSHACPCARPWLYDYSQMWRRPNKEGGNS